MVGHLLEYHPAVEYLKELAAAGGLGDLRYLYSQRLNLGQVRREENALWSLAPHDIAVANFLLGAAPHSVAAVGQAYLTEGVADVAFLTLFYPDRRLAHVHVSWLDPHKTRKLTLVGSRKMAVFDDMEAAEKVRLYDKGVDRSAGWHRRRGGRPQAALRRHSDPARRKRGAARPRVPPFRRVRPDRPAAAQRRPGRPPGRRRARSGPALPRSERRAAAGVSDE